MKLTEQQSRALVKRLADIYEKMGVAGLAVAIFQHHEAGFWYGAGFFVVSLVLTYLMEK
jgi:hypothetical protein